VVADRSTGRLLFHDPRSLSYEAPRRAVRPVSWLHRTGATALDQDGRNGCTGWTGADLLNHPMFIENRRRFWGNFAGGSRLWRRYLGNPEGEHLYRLATRNDVWDFTYPPTDGGSSGLGVAKALKAMGAIDRYEWTFDWSNALGWAQKQPVMVGTIWTDSMSQPDDEGIIHVGNVTLADMAMGHEYLWRGMNYRRGLVRIRNHWTRDWGIDGDAYIPAEELENLILNYQGDVCIPLPLTA
jgi:hypothetical protein